MDKFFTIAFPVYNRTDYFRTALDSAVNQTVKCSILVIDNNSPHDKFREIVDSYANKRIKYIKTDSTVPQDENFNNCIRYCETPWLTILHDDDTLHCQYVELIEKIHQKHSGLSEIAVKCHVAIEEWANVNTKRDFTDDLVEILEPYFYFNILSAFPGVAINKEQALKIGGFNVDLHPIGDNDFWYRMSKQGKALLVNQEFAYYRVSPSQSTNRLMEAMINEIYLYRLNLIKQGKFNTFLTRMALERSRLTNIAYFKRMYSGANMPPKLHHANRMRFASLFFKIPGSRRLVNIHTNRICTRPVTESKV
jgi:GT2 family glycosyltransferase